MKPRRILIIRTDRIGDLVLSTPAIKAVRDAYPDSYIAFMTRPYTKDIVEGNPYLNEVILYDKDDVQKSFLSTLKFALRLRQKSFDIALILHPTNRSHIVAFLAGIPNRIGFDRKLPFLLSKKIKDEKFLGKKHELEYTLELLEAVGIKSNDKSLYVPIKREAENSINAKLNKAGIKESDLLIAVHPGASCRSKRWPVENFGSLIKKLKSQYKVKIILIAGPGDRKCIDTLKKNTGAEIVDFSDDTSVGELAPLLKKCKLFISNDSGPVHIATAVGTPTIAIFGRKQPGLSPKRWRPLGKYDVVLHEDAGCISCLAHNCKNNLKCLSAIRVDEVLKEAAELISKQKIIQ